RRSRKHCAEPIRCFFGAWPPWMEENHSDAARVARSSGQQPLDRMPLNPGPIDEQERLIRLEPSEILVRLLTMLLHRIARVEDPRHVSFDAVLYVDPGACREFGRP